MNKTLRFLTRDGSWTQWWFPNESTRWVSILRVGLAAQVLAWCFSLRKDWVALLSPYGGGLLGREVSEVSVSAESILIPRLSWLVKIGSCFGMNDLMVTQSVWALLVLASLFVATGLFTRASVLIVWFLHLCVVKSAGLLTYGVDDFTSIGLFYLLLVAGADRYSLDFLWLGRRPVKPEWTGLVRRVLQLHLCVVYFCGGFAKACGSGWWNGDSIWRSLTHPPFNMMSPHVLAHYRLLFPVSGIVVVILELGYPVFIWFRNTRPWWLLAIIGMHAAIGAIMGMYLFGFVLIVLNLAAFGWGGLAARRVHLENGEWTAAPAPALR